MDKDVKAQKEVIMNNVYILFYNESIISVYELEMDAIKGGIEGIKYIFSDNLEAQQYEMNAFLRGDSSLFTVEEIPFMSKQASEQLNNQSYDQLFFLQKLIKF